MPAKLIYVIDGREITFPLEGEEITIGRSPDNDVVIGQTVVSRHHAKLTRTGRRWRVLDLGSSNGTRINNEDCAGRELQSGDCILLHRFPITYEDDVVPGFTLLSGADEAGSHLEGALERSAVDFSVLSSLHHNTSTGDRLARLLDVVTKASSALLSSLSLDDTLRTVLDLVFDHLEVERGCILLWDSERKDLTVRSVKTKHASPEIRFSRTIAERVCRDRVAILTSDAQLDSRFAGGASIVALGIRSAMAAPLSRGEQVEGLIYVDTPLRARAFDAFDLDLLSALGNHAAVAIEQARLQRSILEQQLARQRLERYHSPAVIERITRQSDPQAAARVADDREVTVMFADVVGFTDRCEQMEPRHAAELLNCYFSEMAEMVFRHDGTLDKFIGDCLMAVFGAPFATADHARRAAESALDMREALAALNQGLPPETRLEFRVGMHSGRVIAGDIGSVRRSDYTVLGSTVNLAARLESGVARPGQIVVSDVTREALGEDYLTAPLGEFQPKGISRKVPCFELCGRRRTD